MAKADSITEGVCDHDFNSCLLAAGFPSYRRTEPTCIESIRVYIGRTERDVQWLSRGNIIARSFKRSRSMLRRRKLNSHLGSQPLAQWSVKAGWNLLYGLCLCVFAPVAAALHGGDGPHPIAAEPLTSERLEFTDDVKIEMQLRVEGRPKQLIRAEDASYATMIRFTIQPGAPFPWHSHPGFALAGIEKGELIYIYADDCVERHYPSGTMLVDPGGDNTHTAYNPSETDEAVVLVMFLDSPAEGSMTLPVSEKKSVELDQKCGIDR